MHTLQGIILPIYSAQTFPFSCVTCSHPNTLQVPGPPIPSYENYGGVSPTAQHFPECSLLSSEQFYNTYRQLTQLATQPRETQQETHMPCACKQQRPPPSLSCSHEPLNAEMTGVTMSDLNVNGSSLIGTEPISMSPINPLHPITSMSPLTSISPCDSTPDKMFTGLETEPTLPSGVDENVMAHFSSLFGEKRNGQGDPQCDPTLLEGSRLQVHSKRHRMASQMSNGPEGARVIVLNEYDPIVLETSSEQSSNSEPIKYPNTEEFLHRTMHCEIPPSSADVTFRDVPLTCDEIDLYTPRWRRGSYKDRFGWCHLCEKGGWYSMKRSQYLYHMQVYHGVSNLTKVVYDRPRAIRIWEDSSQSVEVLCRYCDSWVSLSHGPIRALSFKCYFKHARHCHPRHSGAKDERPLMKRT